MNLKDISSGKKKNIIKLGLFVALLGAFVIVTRAIGLDDYLDKESFHSWIKGFGPWGPFLYILFYSITAMLLFPGLPITIAAGLAFGPVYGTIFALIGATLGAFPPFFISRYFVGKQVEALLGDRLGSFYEGVEKNGWAYVAFTRLVPIFPYNILNYAFGVTKIKFSHYFIASFIFMAPGTAAYVIFSSSLYELFEGRVSFELLFGIGLIAVISTISVILKKQKAHPDGKFSKTSMGFAHNKK